ncbi:MULTISPECIES: TIGR04325 family methyltransferase [Leptospira]|uniref:TIGR04325 family methyltransferase n=1 Tax=Leptospira TaxID=171 RepID=UPI000365B3AB|nr:MULTISPECIES: TIGR04325 family methyltransferase [Leptospira]MDQ7244397.1 TIGR04325 family methyltransferase [Leptospira borgpetersenii]PTM49661.1 putative methyltransferase (TIGR04325 family) [Leptospira borgpetersenii serovar Javanica]QVK46492.1 methyltransferase, TIGR04325 family [Leptospira borgpetersenii]QVK52145.1 methyltransferase, TIGR04325 family [Leptospira borgpetersenii]QVK55334.1 methyltransferase, TIGR04325 family [Leptospira borgpetersenii]
MDLRSYIKKIAYKFLPPIIWDLLTFGKREFCNRVKSEMRSGIFRNGFNGVYKTWDEAAALCGSYDSEQIIEKCKQSLLKVKQGEAIYERDSVLFNKIQYSWPLLAGLLYSATKSNLRLDVLDFGGSLGSSYYQNRNFLQGIQKLSWNIVEQSNFVQVGKKHFEDGILNFYDSIESCVNDRDQKINVFLASSSFPYVKDPFELIKKIINYDFPYIIIDRTYFIDLPNSIVSVQHVPLEIYDASYPAWFFNLEEFVSLFQVKYDLVADFNSYLQATDILKGIQTREMGMIFEFRKSF